jgi:MarR family transcriptional regulator, transcriptional regulator for hemolysin
MEPRQIRTNNIDQATAYLIHRMARLLRVHLIQFFEREGLEITPEQMFILFKLYEKEGQPQAELADKALNDHPNVTRLLDALEKHSLIARRADPEDRRKSLIFLTEESQALMARLLPLAIEERRRLFKGITQQELDLFENVLKRVEQNILVG